MSLIKSIYNEKHPMLVAEIGINHNGDMALAEKSIEAAKRAGADAVKFQNYSTEDFISNRELTYTYQSQGKTVCESQYDLFKKTELSDNDVFKIAEICRDLNILFSSTPTNPAGVDILLRAGAAYIKNGSDYLENLPLIEEMAKTKLPVVLATGMSTLAEIDDAVRCFRSAGGKELILLQCTSAYPTPPEDVNLRKIPALKSVFGCPIGLSDHSEGITAAIGAAVLGAVMIEKHFTLDKNLPGPDHYFSADEKEFSELAKSVRIIEKQLGSSVIEPAESEKSSRLGGRLSCVAARDLPEGHIIEESDIAFRRPGGGLAPKYAPLLVGMKLKSCVKLGAFLNNNCWK